MCRRPIPQPAIELGWILELLSPNSGHHDEGTVNIVQAGHVAPELLELGDGMNVLLAVAPAFLDILEGDIGGHPARKVMDSMFYLGGIIGKIITIETKLA